MSAEQKLTIMNHICQAMQEKLQSLEIFTKELTEVFFNIFFEEKHFYSKMVCLRLKIKIYRKI